MWLPLLLFMMSLVSKIKTWCLPVGCQDFYKMLFSEIPNSRNRHYFFNSKSGVSASKLFFGPLRQTGAASSLLQTLESEEMMKDNDPPLKGNGSRCKEVNPGEKANWNFFGGNKICFVMHYPRMFCFVLLSSECIRRFQFNSCFSCLGLTRKEQLGQRLNGNWRVFPRPLKFLLICDSFYLVPKAILGKWICIW